MSLEKKKKVVVIGGGFAGSLCAKKLERYFDVILIDTKNYFEFTPGVLRTIVKPEHLRKIQVLHTHYLRRAKVITGKVDRINDKFIYVNGKKLGFSYLIICAGSSYNAPFKEQNLVVATREEHFRDYYKELCRAKKVLIIGGGIVGVELAGEIFWRYGKEKELTIVHASNSLMERNPHRARHFAEKYLKRKGAKIIFNERVVKTNNGRYITNKGRKIKADIAFLCTGITPNFDFMKKYFSRYINKKNQIIVNEHLQLERKKNIFAAGDITDCKVEKTAQNAEIQGEIAVKNIFALERGLEMKKYKEKKTPLVISLGKWNGLFVLGNGFTIIGLIPAFTKWAIEKWEMWKKKF
ncbi:FAD-dependent oxidoreductase [Candidatus Pacearchaeota archaeon]|nr:FAD-dependent oxidoreductase [Candidatus Pacearchaeota archaeon]